MELVIGLVYVDFNFFIYYDELINIKFDLFDKANDQLNRLVVGSIGFYKYWMEFECSLKISVKSSKIKQDKKDNFILPRLQGLFLTIPSVKRKFVCGRLIILRSLIPRSNPRWSFENTCRLGIRQSGQDVFQRRDVPGGSGEEGFVLKWKHAGTLSRLTS